MLKNLLIAVAFLGAGYAAAQQATLSNTPQQTWTIITSDRHDMHPSKRVDITLSGNPPMQDLLITTRYVDADGNAVNCDTWNTGLGLSVERWRQVMASVEAQVPGIRGPK